MNDIFTFSRGRILLDAVDVYSRLFSEARSKTAEHNIYERSASSLACESEKTQKSTKKDEN